MDFQMKTIESYYSGYYYDGSAKDESIKYEITLKSLHATCSCVLKYKFHRWQLPKQELLTNIAEKLDKGDYHFTEPETVECEPSHLLQDVIF